MYIDLFLFYLKGYSETLKHYYLSHFFVNCTQIWVIANTIFLFMQMLLNLAEMLIILFWAAQSFSSALIHKSRFDS